MVVLHPIEMNYRERNKHIDAFAANVDIRSAKLRKFSKGKCGNTWLAKSVSLWPYQTLMIKGKRFCLTRLGFGLIVAAQSWSSSLPPCTHIEEWRRRIFTMCIPILACQDKIGPVWVDVQRPRMIKGHGSYPCFGQRKNLWFTRGSAIPNVTDIIDSAECLLIMRKLVEHHPLCGCLRVATRFIKRRTNKVKNGWDDQVDDTPLKQMVKETVDRVRQEDQLGRLSCKRIWNQCVGRYKLPSGRSGARKIWRNVGSCMLVSVNKAPRVIYCYLSMLSPVMLREQSIRRFPNQNKHFAHFIKR